MERYLLFDAGCAVCNRLAKAIEEAAGGKLEAVSIRDPRARGWLDQVYPAGWGHQPYLVTLEGEQVRASSGTGMALRLAQLLGPGQAWRVWNLARRYGVVFPVGSKFMTERRGFLKRSALFTAGLLLFPRVGFLGGQEPSKGRRGVWEFRPLTEVELTNVTAEALRTYEVHVLQQLVRSQGLEFGPQVVEGYQCLGTDFVIDGIRMLWSRSAQGPVTGQILFTDHIANEARDVTGHSAVAVIQDVGAFYVQDGTIERVPGDYGVLLLRDLARTERATRPQSAPATHECGQCTGICAAAAYFLITCLLCLSGIIWDLLCFSICLAYAQAALECGICQDQRCVPH